jgi:predicted cation transporter
MNSDLPASAGLAAVLALAFLGPFLARRIERNLELFLLACGATALTISGSWTRELVAKAFLAPVTATTIAGIQMGIFQIVLIAGLVIHFGHERIYGAIRRFVAVCSVDALVFLLVAGLGLLASIISSILASIILVEVMHALPFHRRSQVAVTVMGCFAIGLGAALTPFGEPLSTIVTELLSGPPYYADFWFLGRMLGVTIVPGVLLFAALAVLFNRAGAGDSSEAYFGSTRETLAGVFVRGARVFVFIMALIFLGAGLSPLLRSTITGMPPLGLNWANSISAVLDNATLASIEISPLMSAFQVKSALVGLLVFGGMLIPGNIPNIIAAGKFRIHSREWAAWGVPIGAAALALYAVVLFAPAGLAY